MSKPNTSLWTVSKYFEEVYLPDRKDNVNLKDSRTGALRAAVSALDKFAGHEMKLREVSERLLESFKEWSIDTGCRLTTAMDRIWTIKAIVRHWRPDTMPRKKRGGTEAYPQWMAVDCDESLEKICKEQYLVQNTRVTTPRSIEHYARSLKLFSQCLNKVATLGDLTDQNVAKFLRWCITDRKNKAVTANSNGWRIVALWNWAAKVRLVEKFPTVRMLPEPEVIPQAYNRDQLKVLIATCLKTHGKIAGVPAGKLWLAFHLLLWDCGERSGAVRDLRWEMLNLESRDLNVPADIRKGGRKAMHYKLKASTTAAIRAIRGPERELIFPFPKHQRFWVLYRRLIESAGLPYVPYKSGPQKMRRTFASHLMAAGGDPTRALRHVDARVTDESYLDPSIADPVSPNELLFDLV